MMAYHDHNADRMRPGLIARLSSQVVVLVSDAGTPLISDPGYKLVRDARAAGHFVTSIPGPCAAVAALTLAGLPTDRFLFLGFLPNKAKARDDVIAEVSGVRATLIFYESGQRVAAALAALAKGLGDREAAVAREISKTFEETVTGSLSALAERYLGSPPKGEIVVIVAPPGEAEAASANDVEIALVDALTRLSPAQAASQVAKSTGADRKALYARALALRNK